MQHFPPGEAEPFSAPPAAVRDEVVNPSTSSEPTEDAEMRKQMRMRRQTLMMGTRVTVPTVWISLVLVLG